MKKFTKTFERMTKQTTKPQAVVKVRMMSDSDEDDVINFNK